MIRLNNQRPFASGGNRICYRHPEQKDRCLKVLRPNCGPEIRRGKKSFPSNLRPLSYFDENLTEFEVLQYLHTHYPEQVRRHLPTSFGMTQTDLGPAHETSLVTDEDGKISQTLEQYIWEFGPNEIAVSALEAFKENWRIRPPNTRDLIPHNMVIQLFTENHKILLIDGLGRLSRFPLLNGPASAKRCQRRFDDLDARIQRLLQRKINDTGPSLRLNNLIR